MCGQNYKPLNWAFVQARVRWQMEGETEEVDRDPIMEVQFMLQNVFSGDPQNGKRQKQVSEEASVKVVARFKSRS